MQRQIDNIPALYGEYAGMTVECPYDTLEDLLKDGLEVGDHIRFTGSAGKSWTYRRPYSRGDNQRIWVAPGDGNETDHDCHGVIGTIFEFWPGRNRQHNVEETL